MPKLVHLDQATGLPVRKPRPVRYEKQAPGELVHVDIKKLGRIPKGGGWRAHGRGSAQDRQAGAARDRAARQGAKGSRGYLFLHHAVDDHSRLAYSEILNNEKKETVAGFWERARGFFAAAGIAVTAVMTDNGSCYRSKVFAQALGPGVGAGREAPAHPTVSTSDQWESRTVQPDVVAGMGVREGL